MMHLIISNHWENTQYSMNFIRMGLKWFLFIQPRLSRKGHAVILMKSVVYVFASITVSSE